MGSSTLPLSAALRGLLIKCFEEVLERSIISHYPYILACLCVCVCACACVLYSPSNLHSFSYSKEFLPFNFTLFIYLFIYFIVPFLSSSFLLIRIYLFFLILCSLAFIYTLCHVIIHNLSSTHFLPSTKISF